MILQNATSATSADWMQVKSIMISSFDFVQLVIICKHITEIIWHLIVHIFISKFWALNPKYILYFQQMQLFEKKFRVCIIPAVCHDPKGTFCIFDMRSQSKPSVCNSELKVRKDQRIIHQFHCFAERGKYRLSLFITPNVRDILLAIFCVWVPIHVFIYC